MANDRLFRSLRRLEEELHDTETRRNTTRLDALLHADFEEFGRSGRRYDKAAILGEFSAGGELGEVRARDFSLTILNDDVALLTYISSRVDSAGKPFRQTLRSSLWAVVIFTWLSRKERFRL
ncbi:MAG: DUF4440 domain-containing protein [Gammaproteobacteria bacterium]